MFSLTVYSVFTLLTALAFVTADVTWYKATSHPATNPNADHTANPTRGDPMAFANITSKVTTPVVKVHNGTINVDVGLTAYPQMSRQGVIHIGGPTIIVQTIRCCAPPTSARAPVGGVSPQRTSFKGTETSNRTEPLCQANESFPCHVEAVGCFRDSFVDPRPLPELIGDFHHSGNVNETIAACAREAKKRAFSFFGIQNYESCWSGSEADKTFSRDGPSSDCIGGVGRSGANYVYKFQGAVPRPCEDCGKSRLFCFPGKSKVRLSTGRVVAMTTLRVGDKVLTADSRGKPVYSDVIIFLHKNESATAEFYNIVVDDGSQITLSPKHLIFVRKNAVAITSAIFASEIERGNYLYVRDRNGDFAYKAVVTISKVTEKGVYAPLTSQGTIIVDDVHVSCYAHWWSHDLANLALAPLRLYLASVRTISRVGEWARFLEMHWSVLGNGHEIHWYPALLLKLASYLYLTI